MADDVKEKQNTTTPAPAVASMTMAKVSTGETSPSNNGNMALHDKWKNHEGYKKDIGDYFLKKDPAYDEAKKNVALQKAIETYVIEGLQAKSGPDKRTAEQARREVENIKKNNPDGLFEFGLAFYRGDKHSVVIKAGNFTAESRASMSKAQKDAAEFIRDAISHTKTTGGDYAAAAAINAVEAAATMGLAKGLKGLQILPEVKNFVGQIPRIGPWMGGTLETTMTAVKSGATWASGKLAHGLPASVSWVYRHTGASYVVGAGRRLVGVSDEFAKASADTVKLFAEKTIQNTLDMTPQNLPRASVDTKIDETRKTQVTGEELTVMGLTFKTAGSAAFMAGPLGFLKGAGQTVVSAPSKALGALTANAYHAAGQKISHGIEGVKGGLATVKDGYLRVTNDYIFSPVERAGKAVYNAGYDFFASITPGAPGSRGLRSAFATAGASPGAGTRGAANAAADPRPPVSHTFEARATKAQEFVQNLGDASATDQMKKELAKKVAKAKKDHGIEILDINSEAARLAGTEKKPGVAETNDAINALIAKKQAAATPGATTTTSTGGATSTAGTTTTTASTSTTPTPGAPHISSQAMAAPHFEFTGSPTGINLPEFKTKTDILKWWTRRDISLKGALKTFMGFPFTHFFPVTSMPVESRPITRPVLAAVDDFMNQQGLITAIRNLQDDVLQDIRSGGNGRSVMQAFVASNQAALQRFSVAMDELGAHVQDTYKVIGPVRSGTIMEATHAIPGFAGEYGKTGITAGQKTALLRYIDDMKLLAADLQDVAGANFTQMLDNMRKGMHTHVDFADSPNGLSKAYADAYNAHMRLTGKTYKGEKVSVQWKDQTARGIQEEFYSGAHHPDPIAYKYLRGKENIEKLWQNEILSWPEKHAAERDQNGKIIAFKWNDTNIPTFLGKLDIVQEKGFTAECLYSANELRMRRHMWGGGDRDTLPTSTQIQKYYDDQIKYMERLPDGSPNPRFSKAYKDFADAFVTIAKAGEVEEPGAANAFLGQFLAGRQNRHRAAAERYPWVFSARHPGTREDWQKFGLALPGFNYFWDKLIKYPSRRVLAFVTGAHPTRYIEDFSEANFTQKLEPIVWKDKDETVFAPVRRSAVRIASLGLLGDLKVGVLEVPVGLKWQLPYPNPVLSGLTKKIAAPIVASAALWGAGSAYDSEWMTNVGKTGVAVTSAPLKAAWGGVSGGWSGWWNEKGFVSIDALKGGATGVATGYYKGVKVGLGDAYNATLGGTKIPFTDTTLFPMADVPSLTFSIGGNGGIGSGSGTGQSAPKKDDNPLDLDWGGGSGSGGGSESKEKKEENPLKLDFGKLEGVPTLGDKFAKAKNTDLQKDPEKEYTVVADNRAGKGVPTPEKRKPEGWAPTV